MPHTQYECKIEYESRVQTSWGWEHRVVWNKNICICYKAHLGRCLNPLETEDRNQLQMGYKENHVQLSGETHEQITSYHALGGLFVQIWTKGAGGKYLNDYRMGPLLWHKADQKLRTQRLFHWLIFQ